jgi:hypothetical protein
MDILKREENITVKTLIVIILTSLLVGVAGAVMFQDGRSGEVAVETPPASTPLPDFHLTGEPQHCGVFEYREPWVGYSLPPGRCLLVARDEDNNAIGVAWSGLPIEVDPLTKVEGGEVGNMTTLHPKMRDDDKTEEWHCERHEGDNKAFFCVQAPQGEQIALRISVAYHFGEDEEGAEQEGP